MAGTRLAKGVVKMGGHLSPAQIAHIAGCYTCKGRQLGAIKGMLSPEQLKTAEERMKKALV